jgi:hypothetical protein
MLKKRFLKGSVAIAFAMQLNLFSFAQTPLDDTLTVVKEWVETERMLATGRSEWESDKAGITNLITVYKEELKSLNERAELLAKSESIKALEKGIESSLAKAEAKLKALEPLLPDPLSKELAPLFRTIPEKASETKLSVGQRIQPIVAILTQIQKFNQVVSVIEDYREFETGRTVQTETIYFGLGAAYYVDQANEHAGFGYLGEDGWVWKDDVSIAQQVRTFMDVYKGSTQAKYVSLPVDVR